MLEASYRPGRRGDTETTGERPSKALGLAFERSLHPMLIADDERRYVDANVAAELFIRMPRQEILKHRADEFTPPEVREDFEPEWRRFIQSGRTPSEAVWYFPSGERIPIAVGTTELDTGLHLIVVLPWATVDDWDTSPPDQAIADRVGGSRLTPREREVLTLLALGRSGEQVAEELFISPETVRTHVQHVRSKLGASTRGHAIALALTRGEISTDTPSPGEKETRTAG